LVLFKNTKNEYNECLTHCLWQSFINQKPSKLLLLWALENEKSNNNTYQSSNLTRDDSIVKFQFSKYFLFLSPLIYYKNWWLRYSFIPAERPKQSKGRMFRNFRRARGKINFMYLSPLSPSKLLVLKGWNLALWFIKWMRWISRSQIFKFLILSCFA